MENHLRTVSTREESIKAQYSHWLYFCLPNHMPLRCLFPIASSQSITRWRLKNTETIILQFSRSRCRRAAFFRVALRSNPLLAFSGFWRWPHSSTDSPASVFRAKNGRPSLRQAVPLCLILALLFPSLTEKHPCDYTGLTRLVHNNLPVSRSFIFSHLQNPFCQVRWSHSQVPGTRTRATLGGHYSACPKACLSTKERRKSSYLCFLSGSPKVSARAFFLLYPRRGCLCRLLYF